ncbi:MAG: hypothetical protein NZO58_05955 [Gemmataceae bacterium]|nr:hypothetical protein [Gemmataceae bacterium]
MDTTTYRSAFTAVVLVVLLTAPAWAVITALLPLQDVIRGSQIIVVAKVEKLHADKPAMILRVEEELKGKLPFRTLPVNLKGDSEAEKLNHVPQLLKRLADDLPLVLFIEQKDKKFTALAFTNGTWMQLVGDRTGPETAVWSLTHGEPYLRRTFAGTTAELRTLLTDVLAGKKRAPKINEKEPPGFGPEVGGM